jgi:hypothetical protein
MTYEENLKLQLSRFVNDVEDYGDADEYYETIRVITDFLEWSGIETDDDRLQPYNEPEEDLETFVEENYDGCWNDDPDFYEYEGE